MKTQDYLKQITRFEAMIERKKDEVKRFEIMACGIPGNGINPDKIQTSITGDKMSIAVAKIVDKEKEINGLLELYLKQRSFIISQIDALPNKTSYMILTDRYVRDMTWGDIARNLRYSEKQVKRLHAKALGEFESIYGEQYKDNPTQFI